MKSIKSVDEEIAVNPCVGRWTRRVAAEMSSFTPHDADRELKPWKQRQLLRLMQASTTSGAVLEAAPTTIAMAAAVAAAADAAEGGLERLQGGGGAAGGGTRAIVRDAAALDTQALKAQFLGAMQQERSQLSALQASDKPVHNTTGKVLPWFRNGGLELQPLLAFTTLVDVRWLVKMAKGLVNPELGGVLPAWQHLPHAAVATLDSMQAYTGYGLPIAALSYGWASQTHADPAGHHLRTLLPVLETIVYECDRCSIAGRESSFGLLWDWASLPQRWQATASRSEGAAAEDRTPREQARFQAGVQHINEWYAAPYVYTILLDTPQHPSAPNQTPFSHRGWTCFERRVSCLVKAKRCLLAMSVVQRAIEGGLELGGTRLFDLLDQCTLHGEADRPAPMPPDRFEAFVRREVLAGQLTFTNGDDLTEVIIPQYDACFMRALHAATRLVFVHIGWGDDELRELTGALRYAHERGALGRLAELLLKENHFGDEGLAHLRQLIEDGALDTVGFVDLKSSCDGASEEARQAVAAAFESRPGQRRPYRM